jgi:chromosomal replication initiator protein
MVQEEIWAQSVRWLEGELPEREINTWLRPLHPVVADGRLLLLAPNRLVVERVREHFLAHIQRAVGVIGGDRAPTVELGVGSSESRPAEARPVDARSATGSGANPPPTAVGEEPPQAPVSGKLNPDYTFVNFIEGKANSQARAAAQHVVETPGSAYNPMLIYGSSGLGKTHLMHAVGNAIVALNPRARIAYLGAEQWMNHFTAAIRHGRTDEFKNL